MKCKEIFYDTFYNKDVFKNGSIYVFVYISQSIVKNGSSQVPGALSRPPTMDGILFWHQHKN